MIHHSNLFIGCVLEGLCRLIAPTRTVILSCFVFIVFVNILTCLNANLEASTLPSHSYHHIDPNRSSSAHNSNQNTSTDTNYATVATTTVTTTSATTTKSPESHPMAAQQSTAPSTAINPVDDDQISEISMSDAVASDSTTDISMFQHNEREFNHRTGFSATSSSDHPTTTAAPTTTINLSPGATTPSSTGDSDDSDDELRQIHLGNTLMSTSSEETTTLASGHVTPNAETTSDKNVGQIVLITAHRDSNDMQALETNASTSMNSIKRNGENFESKLFNDASSSKFASNHNQNSPASHNLGPYRPQPVVVKTTLRPRQRGLVPLEDRLQAFNQTNNIQQPLFEPLISNASLLDLLHIIKHLNLMDGSSDSSQPTSSDQLLNSNSNVDPINTAPRIVLSPLVHSYRNKQPFKMPATFSYQNAISSRDNNLDRSLQPENEPGYKINQQSSLRGMSEILSTLESSLPGKIISKYHQQLQQQQPSTISESDSEPRPNIDHAESNSKQDTKLTSKYTGFDYERPPMKKPPRHKIISPPYIANFDSGLEPMTKNDPINRTIALTSKDKIRASNDSSKSDSEQKNDSFKMLSNTVKSQPSSPSMERFVHPKTNQILYYSPNNNDLPMHRKLGKKHQANKQHKSVESQENKNKSKATAKSNSYEPSPYQLPSPLPILPSLQSTADSDVNSKRGERDTFENNQNQKTVDSHETNNNADESEKTSSAIKMKQSDNKSSGGDKYQARGEPNQIKNKVKESSPNPIVNRTYTSSSTQSRHVKFPVKINVEQPARQVPEYLSDPHKKSYYWTSERGDVQQDDLNDIAAHYPPQLTIGQLARQHGITPLGLQHAYPLSTLLNNFEPTAVEDFGLSSESGFSEEYASYALPNNHRDPSMISQQGLSQEGVSDSNIVKPNNNNNYHNDSNSQFKLDEQLKQKIAIKAIEAATKDPELSATLFGSLLNLASGDYKNAPSNPIRTVHSHHLNQHQALAMPTKPSLSIANAGVNKNAYKSYSTTDVSYNPMSSSTPAMNLLDQLSVMMPMATMQDNQHANSLHQPLNSSSSAQPINLVITDLANRWALSRMPDLVPIPLAATVPGYLIRLPDGKILAAALTNLFSIQGIQPGPLTANYKNLINNKFNNLVKSPTSSGYNQIQQAATGLHYGGSVSDSILRPTQMLPAHYHYHYANRFVTKAKNSPMEQHKGGFFTRGVLSQLGLGARTSLRLNNRTQAPKLYSTGQSHKASKTGSNSKKASGANIDPRSRQKIVNLASSSYPVPNLSSQELANLPIANPNEPVFSFADESQLLDTPDNLQPQLHQVDQPMYEPSSYSQTASDQSIAMGAAQQQQKQQQLDMMESGSGANFANFGEKLNQLLTIPRNIAHLDRLGGLNEEQPFSYHPNKRKSFTNFFLPKLGLPLYKWLTSIKPVKLVRKDSRACTKKI